MLSLTTASVARGSDPGPPPHVSITANYGVSGMAPFTVHVHALDSTLYNGTVQTARFVWDFGDPSGAHNDLVGWNAAHTYDVPGEYTIKLRIVDEKGQWGLSTIGVTVTPDTRARLYVSPTGSDSNSGNSPTSPIRTVGHASDILTDDMAVLFQRGRTFSTNQALTIGETNVVVGTYGVGSPPVFRWTGTSPWSPIIRLWGDARDVTIEDLELTSVFTTASDIAAGIAVAGTNVTMRRIEFGSLSSAMNSSGTGAYGWLNQDNTAGVVGAYFAWCQGADHVHLGNTVAGSISEHNIRLGNAERLLIAHNDLTNTFKTAIWCMLGEYAYVANNRLNQGRFRSGPNFATSTPSERFRHAVLEANHFIDTGANLLGGSENITIRNNLFDYDEGTVVSISGYQPEWNRTVANVDVFNNTAVNRSDFFGKFVRIADGAESVRVANNLYCAPLLNTHWGAANAYAEESSLASHEFWNNLWAQPEMGSTHHFMASNVTAEEWAALSQTSEEVYRDFAEEDVDAEGTPTFAALVGLAAPGVHVDRLGGARPLTGVVTVGAVEQSGNNDTEPIIGDLNADGLVDAGDVILLLNAWGTADPVADLDGNGIVGVEDLAIVIAGWTG